MDTGLGNIAKTVRTYEKLGAWGIHIEDQKLPKKCGHLEHKHLVSRQAMVKKIQTAVNARKDKDFLIIGRTDARGVEGFDAALERAKAYLQAGADMIFPEALQTKKEFRHFAKELDCPLMANMTEFGKTSYITVKEYEKLGYSIVIFPLTAMRLMMETITVGMKEVHKKGSQKSLLKKMKTRKELYRLLDYKP